MEKLGDPDEAKITWKPQNTVLVDDLEKAEKLLKLIEKLEDDDDVQQVIGNYEIPDEIMEKIEG
jgi:transcriptional/translational regulatory protein YebC/TACO1